MPRIPSPVERKDGSSLISGPRGPPEVLTLGKRYTPSPQSSVFLAPPLLSDLEILGGVLRSVLSPLS